MKTLAEGRFTPVDLDEARDKVMMGTVRTVAVQPEEKHRLAVHEAGHTAAAFYSPGADPHCKVAIIPRGRSLGSHMCCQKTNVIPSPKPVCGCS
jgi:cell division protease FtsH